MKISLHKNLSKTKKHPIVLEQKNYFFYSKKITKPIKRGLYIHDREHNESSTMNQAPPCGKSKLFSLNIG